MSKLEIFLWFNTAFAVVGTFLNARRVRFGFIVWMITNAVFVMNNILIHCYHQAALFAVYFGLAAFGWFSWGKQESKSKQESA